MLFLGAQLALFFGVVGAQFMWLLACFGLQKWVGLPLPPWIFGLSGKSISKHELWCWTLKAPTRIVSLASKSFTYLAIYLVFVLSHPSCISLKALPLNKISHDKQCIKSFIFWLLGMLMSKALFSNILMELTTSSRLYLIISQIFSSQTWPPILLFRLIVVPLLSNRSLYSSRACVCWESLWLLDISCLSGF